MITLFICFFRDILFLEMSFTLYPFWENPIEESSPMYNNKNIFFLAKIFYN